MSGDLFHIYTRCANYISGFSANFEIINNYSDKLSGSICLIYLKKHLYVGTYILT